jgi:hypothetical protein
MHQRNALILAQNAWALAQVLADLAQVIRAGGSLRFSQLHEKANK